MRNKGQAWFPDVKGMLYRVIENEAFLAIQEAVDVVHVVVVQHRVCVAAAHPHHSLVDRVSQTSTAQRERHHHLVCTMQGKFKTFNYNK